MWTVGCISVFIYTLELFSLNCSEPKPFMHLALPGNQHLKINQKLEDGDIALLSDILKGNTYITSLDLRYNRITDSGAKLLADAIKV